MNDGYTISTDVRRLDLDAIHAFLVGAYWSIEIPREVVARSIEGSLCFGVYPDSAQVGFARVISDFATFAYLGDVYILEAHRGRGLGKELMKAIMSHPDLQGLRCFQLATNDAHGLYASFGFKPLATPETQMEISRRGMYTAWGASIRGLYSEGSGSS